jgi:hypothetical protein
MRLTRRAFAGLLAALPLAKVAIAQAAPKPIKRSVATVIASHPLPPTFSEYGQIYSYDGAWETSTYTTNSQPAWYRVAPQ